MLNTGSLVNLTLILGTNPFLFVNDSLFGLLLGFCGHCESDFGIVLYLLHRLLSTLLRFLPISLLYPSSDFCVSSVYFSVLPFCLILDTDILLHHNLGDFRANPIHFVENIRKGGAHLCGSVCTSLERVKVLLEELFFRTDELAFSYHHLVEALASRGNLHPVATAGLWVVASGVTE